MLCGQQRALVQPIMKNKKYLFKTIKNLKEKYHNRTYITGFEFSIAIQDLLISEDGYVIYTGNYENVNCVILRELIRKIKKHPIIWSIFFMVA